MGYILQNDVNYIYEIINTFYYIKNEQALEKDLTDMLNKEKIDPEIYRKKDLKRYYKFINKVKNKIHIDNSKLNMYFSNVFVNYYSYNSLASALLINSSFESLQEYKNILMNSDIKDFYESIFLNIFTDIENGMTDNIKESSKSYDNVINYLTNNNSLSNDIKWYISLIAKDPKKYIIELIDIILNIYNDFVDCYKVFDKDKSKYLSDLKTDINSNSNFLKDMVRISEDLNEDILIYPTMVNYRSFSYCSTFNKVNISNTCMYCGYKFKSLKKHSNTQKDKKLILHEQLKCLGDNSKFEILQLLKTKPRYGQEIANELNITTATISYHMNSLLLADFVVMKKDNNKIYYYLNNDSINIFLNSLNESLK